MNFSSIILKIVNIYLIVFLYRQYKKIEKNETPEEKNETPEEKNETPEEKNETPEEKKNNNIDNDKLRYKFKSLSRYPVNVFAITPMSDDGYDSFDEYQDKKYLFEADSCGQPCRWFTIKGSFVNGFAEGYCKQTYKQEEGEYGESYYEGDFHNGKHHGQGAYYFDDGSYHKGSFKEGYEHGVGYYYNQKTNQTWVGEFNKNRKTRTGRWIDGELYNKE